MMHRAVRSIIPQEVAMFDFLKQKDRTPPVLPEGTVRRHFSISGQVQGVGFRYRARYAAQALELTGWVKNLTDGRVEAELQGQAKLVDSFVERISQRGRIVVEFVEEEDRELCYEEGFEVR